MRQNTSHDFARRLLAVAALVAAASPAGAAEDAPVKKNSKGEYVVATYEVGDLVVNVPDYFLNSGSAGSRRSSGGTGGGMGGGGFGGGMGGMGGGMSGGAGGGMFNVGDETGTSSGAAPLNIAAISDAIMLTVEPQSWAVNNTPDAEGVIAPLGTALVIRQTEAAHRQIGDLLEMLRQGSARRQTVAIDCRWLMLDSDDLERLVTVDDKGAAKVNREVLAEFTRRPTSLRGKTNCFSGQLVYLISGTLRSSVSSYIPVVGSVEAPEQPEIMFAAHRNDAPVHFTQFGGGGGGFAGGRSVGYQPVVTTNNFGVQIEMRPTLMHDGDSAVVDLKSTITFPGSPAPTPAAPDAAMGGMPGGELAPQVDRVAIQTQELATTLNMPLGEPVLVGGMTYMEPAEGSPEELAAPPTNEEPPSGENQQLYLIMELR